MMKATKWLALTLVLAVGAAFAQTDVQSEVYRPGDAAVTVFLHPFLTVEEATILRQIAASSDALAAMLGEAGGHAAIAVSPDDGFIAQGVPASSAVALSQLPDAKTARRDAIAACEAASADARPCVTVLEVSPGH